MDITVGSRIHLPREMVQTPEGLKLFESLEYVNPAWHQAYRLGFAVWHIPKVLHTFEMNKDGSARIYRGEVMKVKKAFPQALWSRDFPNKTIEKVWSVSPEKFKADIHQLRALKAIEENSQGIIVATTSAGKTYLVAEAASKTGQKVLILVHRKILMDQFLASFKEWCPDLKVGVIGGGKCMVGDEVTIAIDKSFAKHKELFGEFGAVFVDECHLVPANTFFNIVNNMPARFRYGLTGTLTRKDKKDFLIKATFGEVIAQITKEELLELNRISPVELNIVYTDFELPDGFEQTEHANIFQDIEMALAKNEDRNRFIAEQAIHILNSDSSKRLIVLTRFVEQAKTIHSRIEEIGEKCGLILGGIKDGKEQCDALDRGDIRIAIATVGTVSTGVSINHLTDLILVAPIFNNVALLLQIKGRLARRAEGKTKGILHILFDSQVYEGWQLSRFKTNFNK